MSTNPQRFIVAIASIVAFGITRPACSHAQVDIDFVVVGDPGNPNDQNYGNGVFGAVANTFAIASHEVTLDQYTAFLNAVAATDPYSLYNTNMATVPNTAGISRTGMSGSFVYAVIGSGAHPVVNLTFYDAVRFVNWLHNGQGTGDTETGAYTLLGGTPTPSNGLTVTRNTGAKYWIPSENEWYKAAYYQPAAAGGDFDGYWLFPTRSNSIPNSRNGSVSDANSANFYRDDGIDNGLNGGYAVTNTTVYDGDQNYLTDVGAFAQATSYYGTFDQAGNVWEWHDTINPGGMTRSLRGGNCFGTEDSFAASFRAEGFPDGETAVATGFRVAAAVVPLALTAAISRKMHGATPFGINLPLTGEPGVECRNGGGAHALVFTFSNNVVSGSASLTGGAGSVSGSPTFAANTMTVNLTGVTDVQKITVTLSGVTDAFAQTLPTSAVSMNVLSGDSTGNKSVNASDVSQIKTQSGAAVTAANFRTDISANGSINASDVSLAKTRSGTSVP